MNSTYRIVWNRALSQFVVASELAKSQTQGGSTTRLILKTRRKEHAPAVAAQKTPSRMWQACLAFLGTFALTAPIQAQTTVNIQNMTPDGSSYGYQYTVPTDGTPLTITGNLNGVIVPGGFASSGSPSSGDLQIQDKFEWTNAPPADVTDYFQKIGTPSQNEVVNVFDPKTGGVLAIPTYDSDALENGGYFKDFSTEQLPVFNPDVDLVNSSIYIGTGLGQVTSAGGQINVDLGDDTKNVREADNTISMSAKQSTLLYADGTAGNDSSIVWQSDNYIDFKVTPVIATEVQGGSAELLQFQDVTTTEYSWVDPNDHSLGVQSTSKTFTISNPTELAAYNNWLQDQFQYWVVSAADGGLALSENQVKSQYRTQLDAAYGDSSTVSWSYKVWDDGAAHDNKATEGIGELHAIHVTGSNASGQIESDARLAVSGSSGGALYADSGATLVNDGQLDHWRTSIYTNVSQGMVMVDSTGINNGVLNSGLFVDKDGRQDVTNWGSFGMHGAGDSVVENNGVINQALTTNDYSSPTGVSDGIDSEPLPEDGWVLGRGMWIEGNSQGYNSGSINLVDGRDGSGNSFGDGTAYGVIVTGNGSFTNEDTGQIYIGREAQSSIDEDTADVNMGGGANLSAGVYVETAGSVQNKGDITLGTGVRNAAGILVVDSSGDVSNSGTININGDQAGRVNYGMTVRNSGASGSTIENTGQINVSGKNNVGLHVLSSTADAEVTTTSTGAITVIDGQDPSTGYRNYAVVVEGSLADTYRATANIQSNIVLDGQGAIGIYVQNHGTVNVAAQSSPVINNTDQIGYLLSGVGAKANIETITTADNGHARTTLFRVADGAEFDGTNGDSGLPMEMTVTGQDSIAIVGSGSSSVVDTGNATLNVGGENSIGVRIEGGAVGHIDADTVINLTGSGATAGVVDGQKYNVVNQKQGVYYTNLDSSGRITSSADDVVAYVARTYGTITLNSDATVNLQGTDNTGVRIEDYGQLINNADEALYVAHGVGVQATGSNAVIGKLGHVQTDDGTAAVQLLDGAGLVADGSDGIVADGTADGILLDTGAAGLTATDLIVDVRGSGTGVENKAGTSLITLTDVTINAHDGAGIRTAVDLNSGNSGNTINVTGAGTGYVLDNYDTSASQLTSSFLFSDGYTVNVGNASGTATGSGVYANTTGAVQTDGVINVLDSTGGSALIARDAQSILNTGEIRSASVAGLAVVDASGSNDKIIQNDYVLEAADATQRVIQSGAGNDLVNLITAGASTVGVINTGAGEDAFRWTAGSFRGAVEFEGTGGNNFALIQQGDLGGVSHIMTPAADGNVLQLSGVSGANAKVGTLPTDDLSRGTNIGSGWNVINVLDSSDVRIVGDLQMAGTAPVLQVLSDSVARVGGHDLSSGSLGNQNVYLGDRTSAVIGTGTLVFDNVSGSQTYGGVISGDGNVLRDAGGTTVLTNQNLYTGSTTIRSGATLQGGMAFAFSAASNHTVDAGATLDTGGHNQQVADLVNAGTVTLASRSADSYLIANNYVGQNGTMKLSLDGIKQVADKLVIDGGTASGQTTLVVQPINSGGFATTGDGIIVVEALNGAQTTAQTTKDAFNLQREYVLAGAYEYRLYAGDAQGQGENWYLRSEFRPDVPLYSALPNVLRGDTLMMLGTLHQRMGDEVHDGRAGSTLSVDGPRLWTRVLGRSGDIEQHSDVYSRASVSSKGFQGGVDLMTNESWNLGVYAGMLDNKAGVDTSSDFGWIKAGDIKAQSYFFGGYGTYTAENGFYADGVLQVGWHDVKLDPSQDNAFRKASFDAKSITASLEVGRPFTIGESRAFIEPQAQLIYMHTSIDDSTTGLTTQVSMDTKDAVIGRVGARIVLPTKTSWGDFTPYARFNLWHTFSGSDYVTFTDTLSNRFGSSVSYTSPELALGFTLDITSSLRLYGEIGHQFRAGSGETRIKSMNSGSLGLKFIF